MPIGNYAGHARASYKNPRAKGECDRCGFWYQLDALKAQFEWAGSSMTDTGSLVCPTCWDVPFEQNRVYKPIGDPQPRRNPRPSRDNPSTGNSAIVGQMIVGQAVIGQSA